MAKRPEKVLPEQWISTKRLLVKMCSQVTIQQQEDCGGSEAGNSEQQQEGRYQRHRREQRHAVNAHARRTQFEDSYYKVDGGCNRGNAEQKYAQDPEVHV